jgi:hypothetical protein
VGGQKRPGRYRRDAPFALKGLPVVQRRIDPGHHLSAPLLVGFMHRVRHLNSSFAGAVPRGTGDAHHLCPGLALSQISYLHRRMAQCQHGLGRLRFRPRAT